MLMQHILLILFRNNVNDKTLSLARRWVREARERNIGIFDESNPLRLEPFEVRFLAQRCPPNRWVIDLSKNDNILIKPQKYYTIPNTENRLFIPSEYLSLSSLDSSDRIEASLNICLLSGAVRLQILP